QCPLIGFGLRDKIPLAVLRGYERIDRIAHPGGILDGRNGWPPGDTKSPVIRLSPSAFSGRRSPNRLLIYGALIDPLGDRRELPIRELAGLKRHMRFDDVAGYFE